MEAASNTKQWRRVEDELLLWALMGQKLEITNTAAKYIGWLI